MTAKEIQKIVKENQITVFVVSPKGFSKQLQDITKALAGLKHGRNLQA